MLCYNICCYNYVIIILFYVVTKRVIKFNANRMACVLFKLLISLVFNYVIHPKEYIYLTLHLEISVVKYSRSKGRVLRDWVLIYNLLVYNLVPKEIKKKGI